ncbi:MAG: aminotransferase class III-fold pyridoxal phosphate-dependent enzyme [Alphaproteobacteria bacterium]|nr:aminotransferase class III-fold pyridoxal phosphate-dependent enzyme [Alphaproteobacteria bacterium]
MSEPVRSEHERSLTETARRVLPAGNFGNGATDIIIAEGQGGHVRDVSGNDYIDYLLGSGPMFAGHAHPEVVAAVQAQIPLGSTFFVNNEAGILLAEAIVDAMACADKVRFVSTGSEADLYAMRVARAYRKRDKILKFEGAYHGMSDYGLMSLAPKQLSNFPTAVPDSPGIPRSLSDEMLVAPFNDTAMAVGLIEEHHDSLGGVIVEPFQRLIPPKPGFLEALRKVTADHGIPLIFDEVVTGFRFAYGGAQAHYGVTPDICSLGKIIGGGFPLAAVAGREEIMVHFDRAKVGDEGFLMQVGTLSGNPIAAAAGLATLNILKRPGTYEGVYGTGQALMDGFRKILKDSGIKAQVVGQPTLFDVIFTDGEVSDYRSTLRADTAMAKRVNGRLRQAGILKGESKFYISLAHTEDDVAKTIAAFAAAIAPERRG